MGKHFSRQLEAAQLPNQLLVLFKILIVSMAFSSCTSRTYTAPVRDLISNPVKAIKTHTVSKGETLYSIAWRYGSDYKKLAKVNKLDPQYRIYIGQKLNLDVSSYEDIVAQETNKHRTKGSADKTKNASRPISSSVKKPASIPVKKTSPVSTASKKPKFNRSKNQSKTKKNSLPKVQSNGPVKWQWPIKGSLLNRFSTNGGLNKGIDIKGKLGDPVFAAATGVVVYAGSGLRGYGKLLIVKHTDKYLSAYAHNNKLLVREGQQLKAGQQIAELGSTGTTSAKLHFELRINGKPVDPLKYLPR